MNLLRIIGSVNPETGGPIEGILQTQQAMQKLGLGRCDIVSLDHPDADYLKGFPLKVFPMGHSRAFYYAQKSPLVRYGYTPDLIPWLRAHVHDYDAVIVHGLWNFTDYAAARVLPGCGVPYFIYTHGMMDPWFKARYPLKHLKKQLSWMMSERRLLTRADGVCFTTEAECKLARGQFPGQDYTEMVVNYGINPPPAKNAAQADAFFAQLPGVKGHPYLLFLSRIHHKKGCDLLVEGFAKLAGRFSDMHLVIAGPDQIGLKAGLIARAEALGVAGRIHWPGMVKGDAKWGAYYNAEAFVLPSHAENFGIVVAEALGCALPVLITDKVNISFAVQRDGGGIVSQDDLPGTEEMLDQFLSLSAEEKSAMGLAARACYEKNFEVEMVVKSLMQRIDVRIRETRATA